MLNMVLKEAHKRVSFRGSSGTLGGVIAEAEFTPGCKLKTGHFVLGRIDFLLNTTFPRAPTGDRAKVVYLPSRASQMFN